MNEIDPGYGWELVRPPLKVGDEWYLRHNNAGEALWTTVVLFRPKEYPEDFVFRRRIDPGEGWEIVPLEVVNRWLDGRRPGGIDGFKNGAWTHAMMIERGVTYRRKSPAEPVAAKPSCQWVKTSERLPRIGWHLASRNDVKSFAQYGTDAFWREESARTGELEVVTTPDYWLDAPEPPKPEGDPAWALAKEYLETALQTTCGNCEHAFLAGFRAGQQSNKGEK